MVRSRELATREGGRLFVFLKGVPGEAKGDLVHTRVTGGALHGIDVHLVQVEVDISSGLPATRTVGLPEAAAREGNERVRAAIQNSGVAYPCKRILINLAPADVRKKGSSLDLAMAVAIIAGAEGLETHPLEGLLLYGELALDGSVRPVPGALAAAMAVKHAGMRGVVVAPDNAMEAAAIGGIEVLSAANLRDVVAHLKGEPTLPVFNRGASTEGEASPSSSISRIDLSDVRGQAQARRALEIAAAGGHNLLLIGPPGCWPAGCPGFSRA
jgi:magnesium chelatase family protein